MELIMEGVELHDQGFYKEAIARYEQAQRVNVDRSDVAYYEIALSYQAMGNYTQSIKAAEKAMKYEGDFYVHSAMVKAVSLDYQGKGKQSIQLFDQLIERYPYEQRLVFNAGVTCMRHEQTEKGVGYFQQVLEMDPLHASSHYYLGLGSDLLGREVEALLAYYMFLLLEPDYPERAPASLKAIMSLLFRGISKDEDGVTTIRMREDVMKDAPNNPMAMIALMLQIRMVGLSKLFDGLTGQELLQASTQVFFEILEVTRDGETPVPEFWEKTYINMFMYIHSNEATQTFACYIAQHFNSDCERWLAENPDAKRAFFALFED